MEFNIAVPQHDELAIGILGRFARLNGMTSTKWAIQALRVAARDTSFTGTISLIAQACGMNTGEFTGKHSMLPLSNPIVKTTEEARDWFAGHPILSRKGLSTSVPMLRWCPVCAKDNLIERGFSHWQRAHQISGLDWCPHHKVPLYEAPMESSISHPGRLQGHCAHTVFPDAELHNHALLRLHRIQLALLVRQRPVHIDTWTRVVRKRCAERDLRIAEVGKRLVASDLIRAQFPSTWLERHMPEVAAKTPGAYIRKIDGACIDRHVCYPSLACAAILAALFDSEERALTLLGEQHKETHSQANIDGAENRAIESFLRGDDIKTACKAHGVTLAAFGTRLRERHSAISV